MNIKQLRIKTIVWFTCLILAIHLSGSIEEQRDKLVIGEVIKIQSKILDEERTLWIYLPENYHNSKASYPVFYLLDGKYHFFHVSGIVNFLSRHKTPQMIVVAIHSTNRNKEFLPTTVNNIPPVVASDKFMMFIKDELIPYIDDHYRTIHSRILCGHSFAGLFTVYFMLNHPEVFTAYFAISPSIYWDERLIFKKAKKFFKNNPDFKKILYFSTAGGDREAIMQGNLDFEKYLRNDAPHQLDWQFRFFKKEGHGSTVHPSIYKALEILYTGWSIPLQKLSKMTIQEVLDHYKYLSEKHSYEIPVPSSILNAHGVLLLRQGKAEAALESLLFFISRDPENPILFFRKGQAYEIQKKLKLAKDAYETAIKLAEKSKHRALPLIKRALAELSKNK